MLGLKKYNIKCTWCGEPISTNIKTQKYCSSKCSSEAIKKPKIVKKCIMCKSEFKTNYSTQKYCCAKCRSESNKERLQGKKTPYTLLRFEILKRDKFKCQYCGRNPREDDIKLVVDHIIPKKKGGKNTANNLITSCQDCNLGKGDILLEDKYED